jgi:hypothetical protein
MQQQHQATGLPIRLIKKGQELSGLSRPRWQGRHIHQHPTTRLSGKIHGAKRVAQRLEITPKPRKTLLK